MPRCYTLSSQYLSRSQKENPGRGAREGVQEMRGGGLIAYLGRTSYRLLEIRLIKEVIFLNFFNSKVYYVS